MTDTNAAAGVPVCTCGDGGLWASNAQPLFGPGAGKCKRCGLFLRNPRATVYVPAFRDDTDPWMHFAPSYWHDPAAKR